MPRIYSKRFDYMAQDEIKALHCALLSEGIHNKDIALWLGTTPQNVGQHFRNCSFSYKQFVIMRGKLEELQARGRAERGETERGASLT